MNPVQAMVAESEDLRRAVAEDVARDRSAGLSVVLAALDRWRTETSSQAKALQRLELEKRRDDLERHIAAGEASLDKARHQLAVLREQLEDLGRGL